MKHHFFSRLLPQDNSLSPQEFQDTVFKLGRFVLIIFLAFMNAFVPISMDLYLPALPQMATFFNCSRALTELTLSSFMFAFALSMLFWGAFSDKLGRKPILLSGLCLYAVSCIICIFSQTIYMLIAGRILQAIGSGAIVSVSMAIVKDTFRGRIMETVLVWIQTMTMLSPLLAPVFGAFLLHIVPWRGLFVILLLCSFAGIVLSFFLKETMKNPTSGPILYSLNRIPIVLKNPGLRSLLLLFSLSAMPFMAYLTSSSFIYIRFFGLSEQAFSYFFAANAIASVLGPLLYVRVFRKMNRRYSLTGAFAIQAICGVLLFFNGESGPFWFLFLYMPMTLFGTAVRPIGTILMMSQLDTDNGTVASLIGSSGILFGSASMIFCSFDWGSPILPVAMVATTIGTICTVLWLFLDTKKVYREPCKGSY